MATISHPIALRIYLSDQFNSNAIDARELHTFLYPAEAKRATFNDWITSRIDYYGFEEGFDYVLIEGVVIDAAIITKQRYLLASIWLKNLRE